MGGDTVRATLPLLSALRRQNKGVLLGYSVEVDPHEAAGAARHLPSTPVVQPVHKRIVAETLQCVDVAAEFEEAFGTPDVADRRTWLAVKLVRRCLGCMTWQVLIAHIVDGSPTERGRAAELVSPSDAYAAHTGSTGTVPWYAGILGFGGAARSSARGLAVDNAGRPGSQGTV